MVVFLSHGNVDFVACSQTLYEAHAVSDVLASSVLKYLLAGDENQFELADLAEVELFS